MITQLEKRFLTIQESATYTGLSVKTIRRMVESGKLTAHRPHGRRIVLDRTQIDNVVRTAV